MQSYDLSRFSKARGIESIEFDEDEVAIICDDSYSGCWDTHLIRFPIAWLALSDEELMKVVLAEKEAREKKEAEEKEKKLAAEKARKYAEAKATYDRLKEEFGE